MSETSEGDAWLRRFLADLTGLVGRLDGDLSTSSRLDAYRFIVLNSLCMSEVAHALAHLWIDPYSPPAGVVYE